LIIGSHYNGRPSVMVFFLDCCLNRNYANPASGMHLSVVLGPLRFSSSFPGGLRRLHRFDAGDGRLKLLGQYSRTFRAISLGGPEDRATASVRIAFGSRRELKTLRLVGSSYIGLPMRPCCLGCGREAVLINPPELRILPAAASVPSVLRPLLCGGSMQPCASVAPVGFQL
jgi:hypothetical protein